MIACHSLQGRESLVDFFFVTEQEFGTRERSSRFGHISSAVALIHICVLPVGQEYNLEISRIALADPAVAARTTHVKITSSKLSLLQMGR